MNAPRVMIVGAGPAGVRAAETLVAAGLKPIVIDENRQAGGQIYRRQPPGFTRLPEALYGTEASRACAVHAAFDRLAPQLDYRPQAQALGVQAGDGGGRALWVLQDGRCSAVPFDALLLATGAGDRVLPVSGWEQGGVWTLGGLQIALKAQGCALGERTVLMGTGPLLYLVAAQYLKAGAQVAAVIDTSGLAPRLRALPLLAARPDVLFKGARLVAFLKRRGVPIHTGARDLEIRHDAPGVVCAVCFTSGGKRHSVSCDAVGLGFHLRAETQLADLSGCAFDFDQTSQQWLPVVDAWGRTSCKDVYLAGDGCRIMGADGAEVTGRLAALAVLADAGIAPPAGLSRAALLRERRRMARFAHGLAKAFPWPRDLVRETADSTVLCRCEGTTAGDMRRAMRDLGATDVNRAKAFSRVGMGRCQGRYCGLAMADIAAQALGMSPREAGRLRGQAPVRPLPLDVMDDD